MFYIVVKSSVCIKFLQANGIEEQYQNSRCPTTSPFTNMYHTKQHKKGFCQIFEYIDMQ